MPSSFLIRVCLTLLFCCVTQYSSAHDTWLRTAESASDPLTFELVTGTRYPKAEFRPGADAIDQSICLNSTKVFELIPKEPQSSVLRLSVSTGPNEVLKNSALLCFVELKAFEIELAPSKVEEYFAEIRASEQIRTEWLKQKSNGQTWRENYRKFAKIEASYASSNTDGRTRPLGVGLELVRQSPLQNIRIGDELTWKLLRDGQLVIGQPVELLGENVPVGIWSQTDEAGMVKFRAIAPGAWLLRTTELRPPSSDNKSWESRFATYAFSVGKP
jgi:uncharacterized GH25 family protein